MFEKIKKFCKENKTKLIIGGHVIACCGVCYYLWWIGYRSGCEAAAEANIQYIKETYPDAYKLIVTQWPQTN